MTPRLSEIWVYLAASPLLTVKGSCGEAKRRAGA